MPHASPYTALPPGYIRIVELEPGCGEQPLEANIHHRPLEPPTSSEHYEAISYCWGHVDSPKQLTLRSGSNLAITASLHSALQSFRYPDRSRLLWADAICINQDDIEERSHQVAIMGEIYALAKRVLVWLGPSKLDDIETKAFILLGAPLVVRGDRSRSDLLRLLDDHLQHKSRCACCDKTVRGRASVNLAEALTAVAKLLERPYFSRLWVVQEVALASIVQIYCGSHNAPWDVFTDIARIPGQLGNDKEAWLVDLPSTLPRSELRQIWARCNYLNQLRARKRTRDRSENPFRPTSLCKDLLIMSVLECQDPLDRIFGVSRVLGLSRFDSLRPNYSIPVGELYRRTVEAFLTAPANRSAGRSAIMLALAGTERREAAHFSRPSWVPNFQYLSERSRTKHAFYEWVLHNRQHGTQLNDFRCRLSPSDPEELMIKGRCFGNVETILDDSECPSNTSFALMVNELFTLDRSTGRTTSYTGLSEETVRQWIDMLPDGDNMLEEDVAALTRDLRPYVTGLPHDRDRKLCTINGIIGRRPAWIPPQAVSGDKVCQLSGAPFPFIVRDHSDGSYALVGDSYVQGMHHAEPLGVDVPALIATVPDSSKAAPQSWLLSENSTTLEHASAWSAKDVAKLSIETSSNTGPVPRVAQRTKDLYRQHEEQLEWIRLR
ncbi:hypothetical protein AC578_221 [Pseudocercospora eumusae]|uniref:Heterokaryon incompatibility domain-containing protein n=1 Tax=Pseudocercospora eumusae TaxID=321146 RepID=A0A139HIP7_9PEZI|nr:hypothetical protein AC578_221 [Pseudocercospora eumusae]